jgi:hypothetical protein
MWAVAEPGAPLKFSLDPLPQANSFSCPAFCPEKSSNAPVALATQSNSTELFY